MRKSSNEPSKFAGKEIPKIKTTYQDLDRMMHYFAICSEFDHMVDEMETRLRAFPNGWRDMRMMQAVSWKVADGLLATIPDVKIGALKDQLDVAKLKIVIGTPATDKPDMLYIKAKDFERIAYAAHEYGCKLCLHHNCKRCSLGKAFDHTLSDYREDNESWFDYDFSDYDGED